MTRFSSPGSRAPVHRGPHGFPRMAALTFFNEIVLIILLGCTVWAAGTLFCMFPINALRAPGTPHTQSGHCDRKRIDLVELLQRGCHRVVALRLLPVAGIAVRLFLV